MYPLSHTHVRKDCYQNDQWYTLLRSRKSPSYVPAEFSCLNCCIQRCYFQKTNLTFSPSISSVAWFLPCFSYTFLSVPSSGMAPLPQTAGCPGHQNPGVRTGTGFGEPLPGFRLSTRACTVVLQAILFLALLIANLSYGRLHRAHRANYKARTRPSTDTLGTIQDAWRCVHSLLEKWRVPIYSLKNGLLGRKVSMIESVRIEL